jgi:predicted component of type VI protein secretion system
LDFDQVRTELQEIRGELLYHRKLLEAMHDLLDSARKRSEQSASASAAAMSMVMENPMIKGNPQVSEMLKRMFAGASSGGG